VNVLEMLHRDHEGFRRLFDRYEELGPRCHRERQLIFEEIRADLEVHRRVEEEILYPAVRAIRPRGVAADLEESLAGHGLIEDLLEDLGGIPSDDRRFDVKFTVLRENVEHHIREEEAEIFGEASRHLDAAGLEALGRQVAARREELQGTIA
jgi:hemerythrin HHE cation binding domain-containing protein